MKEEVDTGSEMFREDEGGRVVVGKVFTKEGVKEIKLREVKVMVPKVITKKGVVGEEGVKEIKLRELKVMVTKVPKVITKNFDRIIQASMQKLEDGQ